MNMERIEARMKEFTKTIEEFEKKIGERSEELENMERIETEKNEIYNGESKDNLAHGLGII